MPDFALLSLLLSRIDGKTLALVRFLEHPVARNLTTDGDGFFKGREFLILDLDPAFGSDFRQAFKGCGIRPLVLPEESPNLNAVAEPWIRSVREECLNELPLLPAPASIKHAINQYIEHHHHERVHQGLGNVIPFPTTPARAEAPKGGQLQRNSRLGGLLNYYGWQGENVKTKAA